MPEKSYAGRTVRIVVFNDITSDERVLEFIDPAISVSDAAVAVVNSGETWSHARVSMNPRIQDLPAEFLMWVLQTAREMTEG